MKKRATLKEAIEDCNFDIQIIVSQLKTIEYLLKNVDNSRELLDNLIEKKEKYVLQLEKYKERKQTLNLMKITAVVSVLEERFPTTKDAHGIVNMKEFVYTNLRYIDSDIDTDTLLLISSETIKEMNSVQQIHERSTEREKTFYYYKDLVSHDHDEEVLIDFVSQLNLEILYRASAKTLTQKGN